MPLNDRQIKAAKPSDTGKKIKLFDGAACILKLHQRAEKYSV